MHTESSIRIFRSTSRYIALMAVIISIIFLPWAWWQTPGIQMVFRPWMAGLREYSTSWTVIDQALLGIPFAENCALRLVNFDRNNPDHVSTAEMWCNRGAYILYPRQILVAHEGVVIGTGRDVIDAQFDPPVAWLQQNRVRVLITITAIGPEQVQVVFTEVPAR